MAGGHKNLHRKNPGERAAYSPDAAPLNQEQKKEPQRRIAFLGKRGMRHIVWVW